MSANLQGLDLLLSLAEAEGVKRLTPGTSPGTLPGVHQRAVPAPLSLVPPKAKKRGCGGHRRKRLLQPDLPNTPTWYRVDSAAQKRARKFTKRVMGLTQVMFWLLGLGVAGGTLWILWILVTLPPYRGL
jgi:hypothetical protein